MALLLNSPLTVFKLTIEVDGPDVGEQHGAFDRVHSVTDARCAGTQVQMHVVQRMSHRVHRVNHKLHLSLLLISGVTTDTFLS